MSVWTTLVKTWYMAVPFMPMAAVVAYACGGMNGAVIVSKYILKDDIRTHGSGNAGLTNFYRTFGGKLTLVVLLVDVAKMVLALTLAKLAMVPMMSVWAGSGPGDSGAPEAIYAIALLTKYWGGLFCLLGHMFPVAFNFKGGKGILSGGTLAILIDWRLALLVWGGFLLLVILTRYVSLGSVYAAAAFPVGTWLFVSHDPVIMTLAIFVGGLVVFMHRGNIGRLLKGEERKFSLRHKKS